MRNFVLKPRGRAYVSQKDLRNKFNYFRFKFGTIQEQLKYVCSCDIRPDGAYDRNTQIKIFVEPYFNEATFYTTQILVTETFLVR